MSEEKQPRIYKFAIMVLPIGVIIGTAVFMWMYYQKHKEESNEQQVIVAAGIRLTDLQDMTSKFTDLIGPRGVDTQEGQVGLQRAAAMIEGRLGPQNMGFKVFRGEAEAVGERLWKSLWVDVRGGDQEKQVLIVAVSFSGPGEIADANTVSTVMMLASSLAEDKPSRTIRLVFLPMKREFEEQNRWLVSQCLRNGETCAGIVGLHVMDGAPQAGGDEWLVSVSDDTDMAWWQFLSGVQETGSFSGGEVPTVWLTHAVYSNAAWEGKKEERIQATIPVAQQLRDRIWKAAN